ncbi:MAG: serine--tRNA ligase [Bacteroidota bacterium]
MLLVNDIRDHREKTVAGLRKRHLPDEQLALVDRVLELDEQRKNTQHSSDTLKAEMNKLSKAIGGLYKEGKRAEAEEMKQQVTTQKVEVQTLQDQLHRIEGELEQALLQLPNVPHERVPSGNTEEDNEVYQKWDAPLPEMGEKALPHWELAKTYPLFDLELGVKIAGSGFPVYRGKGARLQRALVSFFLDEAADAGYEEVLPPHLVNEDTARATGQLPDKEGQMYYVERDDLYLIPTAEVPVTNIYRDVILSEDDFPIKMTAYTPCFRREAGSYGAHVRGLNRVHQFDKVEIVRIEHPDRSYDALEEMLDHVRMILKKLELPYRILTLCGGDLGFTSALTYDFEVYSAAQKRWLEVSSVSNFETFQSNRLHLRYRAEKGRVLAHTLNGSALALARIVAAIVENNQTEKGIVIPEVLRKYTGFDIIEPS